MIAVTRWVSLEVNSRPAAMIDRRARSLQRQRVCQGVTPPLAVNLPSLIVYPVPSVRLLARALMRRSDAISIVNLRA